MTRTFTRLENKLVDIAVKKVKEANSNKTIRIYTDGSCLKNNGENPGTFAFVILADTTPVFEYSSHKLITTNNRMELIAITYASQIANKLAEENIRTHIYTDSQYSLNVLYGTWKAKKNTDIQKLFNSLKINRKMVECSWVRGHVGNRWNERADELCSLEYKNVKKMKNTRISNKDAHMLSKMQNKKEITITGNSEVIKLFEAKAKDYNNNYKKRFGLKEYKIGKLKIKIK